MVRLKIWRRSSHATEPTTKLSSQPAGASSTSEESTTPADPSKVEPATTLNAVSSPQGDVTGETALPTRKSTTASHSAPETNSSAIEPPQRWVKVLASHSSGPWRSGTQSSMRAFKPPPVLGLLDSKAHNPSPRSPLAWFIDELGITVLKIIPRGRGGPFVYNCEYELSGLNISKSVPLPQGYCEPFISTTNFLEASWRTIPIFTTPLPRSPFRRMKACEVIDDKTERIIIAFDVFFLDTNEHDQYCRTSYEESWTYYACNRPTLQDFYEKYGHVLTRTLEEHRTAREFYMGPMKLDRPLDTEVPKMYEESKKFLKVDRDAEHTYQAEHYPAVPDSAVETDSS